MRFYRSWSQGLNYKRLHAHHDHRHHHYDQTTIVMKMAIIGNLVPVRKIVSHWKYYRLAIYMKLQLGATCILYWWHITVVSMSRYIIWKYNYKYFHVLDYPDLKFWINVSNLKLQLGVTSILYKVTYYCSINGNIYHMKLQLGVTSILYKVTCYWSTNGNIYIIWKYN